ncbi:hypothetical protein AWB70_01333 [Caballeronia cordobensis]|uniref:Uncharacterized protein n=1 Tax=Caballeronia cordobensis TaxID=1353886 RepID=A0A158FXW2_CABCO|nr:hypothetical protein [Caballeronia cordobensis]SAL24497.1 hypothetical protein AWB70_01333 [Caballeronia cordobensis]
MKRLTAQVMYHPLVALSSLYLTELMSRPDLGLSGTLFMLATRSISRIVTALRSNTV